MKRGGKREIVAPPPSSEAAMSLASPRKRWRKIVTCAAATLLFAFSWQYAHAERLIASLSSHVVQITSNFTGVELTLFGTVENPPSPGGAYDIVVTVIGPRQSAVARKKDRMLGIWINAASRTFVDVPAYLAVLTTRPLEGIAAPEMLHREQIGIANISLPQQIGQDIADVVPDDPFRRAFVRIKQERRLYDEVTNAVTFLTPTLYRASIFVPAEAPVGNYDVDVKLFAGGAVVARTSSAFEIKTVGFERFIANAAANYGLAYGLATTVMAMMTGWFASILFRRD
jgi:uncharacterized protein (TIGR02186 family)